jgi:hypothetical protein
MAKAKGFNLAKVDTIAGCNRPVEIEIKDLDGEPTDIFFSILGKDSDVVRARLNGLAEDELQAEAAGIESPSNVDRGERRMVTMCVSAVTGWRTGKEPALAWGDERLEFNEANARKVISGIPHIRAQVSTSIFNLSLFMKG